MNQLVASQRLRYGCVLEAGLGSTIYRPMAPISRLERSMVTLLAPLRLFHTVVEGNVPRSGSLPGPWAGPPPANQSPNHGKLLIKCFVPIYSFSQIDNLVESAVKQARTSFEAGDHFATLCYVEDSLAALFMDGQALADGLQVRTYVCEGTVLGFTYLISVVCSITTASATGRPGTAGRQPLAGGKGLATVWPGCSCPRTWCHGSRSLHVSSSDTPQHWR